jgi:hypothetical protein
MGIRAKELQSLRVTELQKKMTTENSETEKKRIKTQESRIKKKNAWLPG